MNKRQRRNEKLRKTIKTMLTMVLLIAWNVESVQAHKIIVFAYREGDSVFVESKFSGGKKVKNGRVSVIDSTGHEILSGKTDDQGRFSFMDNGDKVLDIIVDAGTGHQNHWVLSSQEAARTNAAESKPAAKTISPGNRSSGENTAHVVGLDEIETALDRKLAPVINRLDRLEAQQRGPSLTDILGGIGYILGIVGIVTLMRYRRKKNDG